MRSWSSLGKTHCELLGRDGVSRRGGGGMMRGAETPSKHEERERLFGSLSGVYSLDVIRGRSTVLSRY